MTTVATEDQEQPNPSHEREARILDVTPGCRTSSGPAETRSAPKGRTYDRSRPSRSKHQIVLATRGRPHMRWRSPVSWPFLLGPEAKATITGCQVQLPKQRNLRILTLLSVAHACRRCGIV